MQRLLSLMSNVVAISIIVLPTPLGFQKVGGWRGRGRSLGGQRWFLWITLFSLNWKLETYHLWFQTESWKESELRRTVKEVKEAHNKLRGSKVVSMGITVIPWQERFLCLSVKSLNFTVFQNVLLMYLLICRYINFLAEMVASDRPVEHTNRDSNKKVVITSNKGQQPTNPYTPFYLPCPSISLPPSLPPQVPLLSPTPSPGLITMLLHNR